MTKTLTVGVAILTYNAAKLLEKSLPVLLAGASDYRILIVDSSSKDGTEEIVRSHSIDLHVIPQSEFNHGTTRELARRLLGTDIAVMMTHDAIPVGPEVISRLVAPLRAGEADASYARQIPHDGAGFFEAFPRQFNYPDKSELRSLQDIPRLGPRTFFCSNSCCAWLNAALDEIGGFQPTLSLEDTITAAKLVQKGYRIAYCADAQVKHSHHYTLMDEFRRHFDIGYVRAMHRDLLFTAGGDEKRGVQMTGAMLAALWKTAPQNIPYAIAVVGAKFLGYKIGYYGHRLPRQLKKHLSGQSYYWDRVPG